MLFRHGTTTAKDVDFYIKGLVRSTQAVWAGIMDNDNPCRVIHCICDSLSFL